jgi:hypothetical protein
MNATATRPFSDPSRYRKCIEASKRMRFDIDADVFRGRQLDFTRPFLPDSLSRVRQLSFLSPAEQTFLSQIQGRTYTNIFGLVERFIGAKILELSKEHWLGDQTVLESLVRFTDEELKHQEMFRRLEAMTATGMPEGYRFDARPDDVARAVLGASTWAVLGLTFDIEVFTQVHYRSSIQPDEDLSPLWKDVFLFHWREEAQHAILDELEWRREDARLSAGERDRAVDDLVGLVHAVDGILQAQARADAEYFLQHVRRSAVEQQQIRDAVLAAYRWQYLWSGLQEPRFLEVLQGLITPAQGERIRAGLATIGG